ncbi:MAG: hypothetical protein PVG39_01845 [Desulfobacteraceae bacterium]
MALHDQPEWTSFDVIKGVFRYLPDDKPISSSRPELHTAIYNLSIEEKYKRFLKGYLFEKDSYFPFSRDLNIDILNLEQSGHLSADNPDFVDYKKKPKLEKTFDLYTKGLFDPEELELIQEMAELFAQIIH